MSCPSMFIGNHCDHPTGHPGVHYSGGTVDGYVWTDDAADTADQREATE